MNIEYFGLLCLGLIFCCVGFGLYFIEVHDVDKLPKINITTNCYDRQWNVIDNVTCSEEVFEDNEYNGINGMAKGIGTLMLFTIGLIGILFIIVSIKLLIVDK